MTKIKICGITNLDDALCAEKLGADYIGFNFYIGSSRYIGASKAKKIISKLPDGIKIVGVFVNDDIEKIKVISSQCNLDIIQLSGNENKKFVSELKKKIKIPIIKSIRIKNRVYKKSKNTIKQYNSDYILLDTFKKEFYGGTGETFDLDAAKQFDSARLFLSGGLNAANVKTAIKKVNPFAVDVCSGVEISHGKKDFDKLKNFIEAAK